MKPWDFKYIKKNIKTTDRRMGDYSQWNFNYLDSDNISLAIAIE